MLVTDNATERLLPAAIEAFWSTIPPVWNRVKGNVRAIALEHYDISVEQFHILRHIRKGFTSVSELAEVKQISRSAISQAVDILVERGLICRRQNALDRRNIPLELTESGNSLLDTIWEKNRGWMKNRMASLTERDLKTITCAMEILNNTFAGPAE
ncbi:MAG: MarR family transcriptional regulator [Anaerolineales bacterium]|jgi:DNA-binding MarR family transcriptional regulator